MYSNKDGAARLFLIPAGIAIPSILPIAASGEVRYNVHYR